MAATCAGLGDSQLKTSMNLGWLMLVPGLGLIEAHCCLFERISEVVQHEPKPDIHMEEKFGWAPKLWGGAESLGISEAG